jgi:hypothetical protein
LAKKIILLAPDVKRKTTSSTVPMTLHVSKGRHGKCVRLPVVFHFQQFRFAETEHAAGATEESSTHGEPKKRLAADRHEEIDPLAGR